MSWPRWIQRGIPDSIPELHWALMALARGPAERRRPGRYPVHHRCHLRHPSVPDSSRQKDRYGARFRHAWLVSKYAMTDE